MSQYTTGEIAKLCGVTVRTVQYYDKRGVLVPSALSEGGRRLYSGDDLRRMKVICFLRELGLPLDAIGQLLAEKDPGSVIEILIDQQAETLRGELDERREQLEKLEALKRELRAPRSVPWNPSATLRKPWKERTNSKSCAGSCCSPACR